MSRWIFAGLFLKHPLEVTDPRENLKNAIKTFRDLHVLFENNLMRLAWTRVCQTIIKLSVLLNSDRFDTSRDRFLSSLWLLEIRFFFYLSLTGKYSSSVLLNSLENLNFFLPYVFWIKIFKIYFLTVCVFMYLSACLDSDTHDNSWS